MFLGKCLTSQSANISSWNDDINENDKSNDTHFKVSWGKIKWDHVCENML